MFQTLFQLSDKAMTVLFSFFSIFRTLCRSFPGFAESFVSNAPHNIHAARKVLGDGRDCFQKYICCPTWHAIYPWTDCVVRLPNVQVESKKCSYIQFPNHPQLHHRNACGTTLMKSIKSPTGKVSLYPRLVYCYWSIIQSLQELLKRHFFLQSVKLGEKGM